MPTPNFAQRTSVIYPIAFNHLALMDYHSDRTLEEIILFEKLLVAYRTFRLKPFYYQQFRLMEDLHLKRDRVERGIASLERAGVLVAQKFGSGKKIKYSLDLKKLIGALPFLYKMPEDVLAKQRLLKELEYFFTYYLTARYLSANPDPSVPDEVYEGKINLAKNKRDFNSTGDESGENSTYKIN